jgi:hypothetical protein
VEPVIDPGVPGTIFMIQSTPLTAYLHRSEQPPVQIGPGQPGSKARSLHTQESGQPQIVGDLLLAQMIQLWTTRGSLAPLSEASRIRWFAFARRSRCRHRRVFRIGGRRQLRPAVEIVGRSFSSWCSCYRGGVAA